MEPSRSSDGSSGGMSVGHSAGGMGGLSSDFGQDGLSSLLDPSLPLLSLEPSRSRSPARPPTSAEIDAVIAAAMANAPPPQPAQPEYIADSTRPIGSLMTNMLPAAVGADGRVHLFVGNLPYRVRWQDLKDLFRKAGTVLRADVSLGPDNRSRGYGSVLMGSREDAARAIDRYNGYTWQTRTLEVRPDRLPPEYEPQQHFPLHVNPHPRPMYGHSPIPGPGSGGGPYPYSGSNGPGPGTGMGMSMSLGPMRPPYGGAQGGRPTQSLSPHIPPGILGPSSSLAPSSSTSPYPGGSSPLPGSNGPHSRDQSSPFPIAPSPLAGALTGPGAGTIPSALPIGGAGASTEGLEALGAFAGLGASPEIPGGSASGISGRALSPAMPDGLASQQQITTRDSGTNSTSPRKTSPSPRVDSGMLRRPGAPGQLQLGPLPPSMLGVAPSASGSGTGSMVGGPGSDTSTSGIQINGVGDVTASQGRATAHAHSQSQTGGGAGAGAGTFPPPHFPVQIEGMAHQGIGLGPPGNLHDRVVFVSNMPLNMQWQDLKDLLRPAGMIMRADVAQDDNRRPRGYGTALFATEGDATRAVQMFNGREVGGRQLRVYLERDSHVPIHPYDEHSSAPQIPMPPQSDLGASSGAAPSQETDVGSKEGGGGLAADQQTGNGTPGSASPIGSRLPWSLNTAVAQTPQRGAGGQQQQHGAYSPGGFPGGPTPGPSFRAGGHHPGPISMPPFAPLDTPNPLSPLHSRGLPPMTPSMPGFVFNAYPETPMYFGGYGGHGGHGHGMQHGHGHGYGSMGMGMGMGMGMSMMGMSMPSPSLGGSAPPPFSPGLPMSPIHPGSHNPFLNSAPGAPIERFIPAPGAGAAAAAAESGNTSTSTSSNGNGNGNGNKSVPKTPGGPVGSAILDTPTTTSFPASVRGYAEGQGQGQEGGETPGVIMGGIGGGGGGASNGYGPPQQLQQQQQQQEYFPYVPQSHTQSQESSAQGTPTDTPIRPRPRQASSGYGNGNGMGVPLNAKDRLAPDADVAATGNSSGRGADGGVDGVVGGMMRALTLAEPAIGGNGEESRDGSPRAKSRTKGRAGVNLGTNANDQPSASLQNDREQEREQEQEDYVKGRQSMDDSRPRIFGSEIEVAGERRASFGDPRSR